MYARKWNEVSGRRLSIDKGEKNTPNTVSLERENRSCCGFMWTGVYGSRHFSPKRKRKPGAC